jgi:hypothetical protein
MWAAETLQSMHLNIIPIFSSAFQDAAFQRYFPSKYVSIYMSDQFIA